MPVTGLSQQPQPGATVEAVRPPASTAVSVAIRGLSADHLRRLRHGTTGKVMCSNGGMAAAFARRGLIDVAVLNAILTPLGEQVRTWLA